MSGILAETEDTIICTWSHGTHISYKRRLALRRLVYFTPHYIQFQIIKDWFGSPVICVQLVNELLDINVEIEYRDIDRFVLHVHNPEDMVLMQLKYGHLF